MLDALKRQTLEELITDFVIAHSDNNFVIQYDLDKHVFVLTLGMHGYEIYSHRGEMFERTMREFAVMVLADQLEKQKQ
jgi:hypothetical protein